jgi:hypothetical protein
MKRISVVCALPWLMLLLGSTARAEYRNCSEEQINTLAYAGVYAGLRLIGAGRDITSIRQGGDTSHFETYFGPATGERVDGVESVLLAAYSGGLSNADYVCGFSLGCLDPSVLMWTEHASALAPSPSWGIYVCDLYFAHPEVQVGTLIHELTHLYGTSDISADEGQLAPSYREIARVIAANNPDRAVQLAINYEYYVVDGN